MYTQRAGRYKDGDCAKYIYPDFLETSKNVGLFVVWRMYANQHSVNGIHKPMHTTVASCQNYCLSLQMCVAVDFNVNDNSCWVHTDSYDLHAYNTFFQLNTNQYRRRPWVSRVTQPTTTTTTTTTTVATISARPITSAMTLIPGLHSVGAIPCDVLAPYDGIHGFAV